MYVLINKTYELRKIENFLLNMQNLLTIKSVLYVGIKVKLRNCLKLI